MKPGDLRCLPPIKESATARAKPVKSECMGGKESAEKGMRREESAKERGGRREESDERTSDCSHHSSQPKRSNWGSNLLFAHRGICNIKELSLSPSIIAFFSPLHPFSS